MLVNLVRRLKMKDERAFDEIYWRFRKKIFLIAFNMVEERATAEDISQEVFAKMYREVHKLEKDTSFTSWFLRLAKNETIDYLRKKGNKKVILTKSSAEIDKNYGNPEEIDILFYLDILEEDEKEVMSLRIIYGYTFRKIKDEMKISKTKVLMIYSKAINKLKEFHNE
ncbi:sigma-70 family RNA polymerase sigma factor [Acholeplasma sp. OttesenSCG-928-E16]|nr:sigma-70 family RNA polymerase sigma factor [Acholeplasma sp. OttesenSCG-928-E16]